MDFFSLPILSGTEFQWKSCSLDALISSNFWKWHVSSQFISKITTLIHVIAMKILFFFKCQCQSYCWNKEAILALRPRRRRWRPLDGPTCLRHCKIFSSRWCARWSNRTGVDNRRKSDSLLGHQPSSNCLNRSASKQAETRSPGTPVEPYPRKMIYPISSRPLQGHFF